MNKDITDNDLDLNENDERPVDGGSSDGRNDNNNNKKKIETTDTSNSFGGNGNEVLIMDPKQGDRTTSFFAQPGILAGMYIG